MSTTIWEPDTCYCLIEYDEDIRFVKAHSKCLLHEALDGDELLQTVITHNRGFNLTQYDPDPEKDAMLREEAKEKEKERSKRSE